MVAKIPFDRKPLQVNWFVGHPRFEPRVSIFAGRKIDRRIRTGNDG